MSSERPRFLSFRRSNSKDRSDRERDRSAINMTLLEKCSSQLRGELWILPGICTFLISYNIRWDFHEQKFSYRLFEAISTNHFLSVSSKIGPFPLRLMHDSIFLPKTNNEDVSNSTTYIPNLVRVAPLGKCKDVSLWLLQPLNHT